jgi:hypothetical protein
MSSKLAMLQITQQLQVFSGRMTRAERDQQLALAALKLARHSRETAEDLLLQIETQLADANTEFIASAASEQARIWRDTLKERQIDAGYHLEQCRVHDDEATDELRKANSALQKLQLQKDQILARRAALAKAKLKRQEAIIEDDRNAANAAGSGNIAIGL